MLHVNACTLCAWFTLASCTRLRNLEWFATTAWNTGREAGLAGDYMSSAVLFGACADFYSAHPVKDASNLGKQKVSKVALHKYSSANLVEGRSCLLSR